MDYSSSTAELYEPQELSNTTVITCEFCYRPAEISVEKIIRGNMELVWPAITVLRVKCLLEIGRLYNDKDKRVFESWLSSVMCSNSRAT